MTKNRPQCGLLIENGERKILLQLRDDSPAIPYPNCWGTFGGQVEPGETPAEAIRREIKEELDYDLAAPEFFGIYPFDGYDIFMFRKVDPSFKIENLIIREGQRAEFFSHKQAVALRHAFNCQAIVEDYFKKFP
jgi:8-oxo-dGTP pyrophosphatase MutT (NUDIX family)